MDGCGELAVDPVAVGHKTEERVKNSPTCGEGKIGTYVPTFGTGEK